MAEPESDPQPPADSAGPQPADVSAVSQPGDPGPDSPADLRRRQLQAAAGVALALIVGVSAPLPAPQGAMAGLAVLMAVWWVFEVVPLFVTALIPLVAFPLFGVAKLGATADAYGSPTVYLFFGGWCWGSCWPRRS